MKEIGLLFFLLLAFADRNAGDLTCKNKLSEKKCSQLFEPQNGRANPACKDKATALRLNSLNCAKTCHKCSEYKRVMRRKLRKQEKRDKKNWIVKRKNNCKDKNKSCSKKIFNCERPKYAKKLKKRCPQSCGFCLSPQEKCVDTNANRIMDLIANYESDSKKEQEVVKAKSRKSYSAEFKLKVVNFTKSVGGSNHSASKKFGVDRSTVIDWVKQEQKQHGPIPAGQFELLLERNAIRQTGAVVEEVDADQDKENGYVSDESLELDWNDELNAPNPEFHAFRCLPTSLKFYSHSQHP